MVISWNIVFGVVGLGGGISGFISLYVFLRKFRGKAKVHTSYGYYEVEEKQENKTNLLEISVGLLVYNGKEEPVSITDVAATLRYNAKRFEPSNERQMAFSSKPVTINALPQNIGIHESIKLDLKYHFQNINVEILDRFGTFKILGFYQNTPIAVIDQRENELNWKDNPLQSLLSVHLNGDKIIHVNVPLVNKKLMEGSRKGSLNPFDIARIEKDFLKNKIK